VKTSRGSWVPVLASVLIATHWLAGGCGAATLRRFSDTPILWRDDDAAPFSPRPEGWYSPFVWDGADNSVFRPLAEVFALEPRREAVNVNALDEVPDSSWYTNRLSRSLLSADTVARGACEDEDVAVAGVGDDVGPPFMITRGKPDGSSPGLVVRDALGRTYLMKADGELQLERPSAADTVSAAIFHAAGFFAPCNRVVWLDRAWLELEPGAEARYTDGRREPLTETMVEDVLSHAVVGADGRLRFGLSRFIDGDPISAWTYQGTWTADPNDVVAHERRRELRGMYVLSSWLGHIDSREENTLASWMPSVAEGWGHVRHYVIDFSDTLGILHRWTGLHPRFGHSGYFDVQHIAEDFVTLGLLDRPWHDATLGRAGAVLGHFDVERYVPDAWRPGYPNAAFERMSELDGAWMARIIARFGDTHIEALVARARFSRPLVAAELSRILRGRRDRLLERWLTRLSPLTDPAVEGRAVCVEDRAVTSGLREDHERVDTASLHRSPRWEPIALATRRDAGWVCVSVPVAAPGYLVVDLVVDTPRRDSAGPLRLHVVDAMGVLRIVGLERPGDRAPPRP